MDRLVTERLILVPGSAELSRAELAGREALSELLGAEVTEWPPPLNDEDSQRWSLELYESDPQNAGWGLWYFLLARDGERPLAAGNGGFKGRPAGGEVEIGYSVLERHQGQGLATEAVGALVDMALERARVRQVCAHTLPVLTPSIRVLEKCGFTLAGAGAEEGTIRFELDRREWEA